MRTKGSVGCTPFEEKIIEAWSSASPKDWKRLDWGKLRVLSVAFSIDEKEEITQTELCNLLGRHDGFVRDYLNRKKLIEVKKEDLERGLSYTDLQKVDELATKLYAAIEETNRAIGSMEQAIVSTNEAMDKQHRVMVEVIENLVPGDGEC